MYLRELTGWQLAGRKKIEEPIGTKAHEVDFKFAGLLVAGIRLDDEEFVGALFALGEGHLERAVVRGPGSDELRIPFEIGVGKGGLQGEDPGGISPSQPVEAKAAKSKSTVNEHAAKIERGLLFEAMMMLPGRGQVISVGGTQALPPSIRNSVKKVGIAARRNFFRRL